MRKVVVILLVVCCYVATYAEHLVGVSLSPTATWQFDTLSNTRSVPGIAGDIGFAYQYQHRALLLQTGVNIGMTTMRQKVDSMYIGQDTLLHNRVDDMQTFELNIPLMIGAKIDHFYALVGIKAVFASKATTTQRGTIAIREGSDRYYEDYNKVFMDAHEVRSKGRMDINPDLRACVEIGTQWQVRNYYRTSNFNPILQIGLFAEYNILNYHPTSYTKLHTANSAHIALQHIYAAHIADGTKLNNLHAGIRVTLLFDITVDDCHCFEY